jgi:FeS assembly SUF system protein
VNNMTHEELKAQVEDALKTVFDPEIPVNIWELGLIYDVEITEKNEAVILMTLTSPSCPVAGILPGEVEDKARGIYGVEEAKVILTFDPPWDKDMMSDEAKLELGFM